jgi:hypothetical protein
MLPAEKAGDTWFCLATRPSRSLILGGGCQFPSDSPLDQSRCLNRVGLTRTVRRNCGETKYRNSILVTFKPSRATSSALGRRKRCPSKNRSKQVIHLLPTVVASIWCECERKKMHCKPFYAYNGHVSYSSFTVDATKYVASTVKLE